MQRIYWLKKMFQKEEDTLSILNLYRIIDYLIRFLGIG